MNRNRFSAMNESPILAPAASDGLPVAPDMRIALNFRPDDLDDRPEQIRCCGSYMHPDLASFLAAD